jgi:hypothetical protein
MLALQARKQPDFMFWGAALPAESEFSLEDPLALDYLNQQIGYRLLPALTTRSAQAQYFAVVLYGLELAERALRAHALPDDDRIRRDLFERWERFWALACLESRKGALTRSDPDAMRGVRGAQRAWFSGDNPLPLKYTLISRQSELGGLGAYLIPLRDLGLVYPGTLRVTPAAGPIIEAFWEEVDAPAHSSRFDNWALSVLAPSCTHTERKFQGIRLATLGERSRLTSILGRQRQQDRVFEAVLTQAPPPTAELTRLVQTALLAEVDDPRELLQGLLDGRFGTVATSLRDGLALALVYGDIAVCVRDLFDAIYRELMETGNLVARAQIIANAVTIARLDTLRGAASALLGTPELRRLRQLPAHGAAFVRLLELLVPATPAEVLDLILRYHRQIQRARSSGSSWISEQGDTLRADLTHYTGYQFQAPFPGFKLFILASLLRTTGRLPATAATQEVA